MGDVADSAVLHQSLRARLDAPRGQCPWNGGPRLTLRALLLSTPSGSAETLRWVMRLSDGDIRARRAGAWDANQLEDLAVYEWERDRRAAGVSNSEVKVWLEVCPECWGPSDPGLLCLDCTGNPAPEVPRG